MMLDTCTLVLTVPHDPRGQPQSRATPESATSRRATAVPAVPAAVAVCVAAGLAVAAGESLLVIHGVWLAADFGLSVSQIGAFIGVIVVAELAGEGLAIAIVDRLGHVRTVLGALLLSAAAYAALGVVGHHIGVALIALGVRFVALEVTIVALTAVASTIVDAERDAVGVLGSLMAVVASANAVGAVVGPVLFSLGGIGLSGAVSACAVTAAAGFLWWAGDPTPARVARRPHGCIPAIAHARTRTGRLGCRNLRRWQPAQPEAPIRPTNADSSDDPPATTTTPTGGRARSALSPRWWATPERPIT